jgi:hypothetical protein
MGQEIDIEKELEEPVARSDRIHAVGGADEPIKEWSTN